jgi:hypothetical protein
MLILEVRSVRRVPQRRYLAVVWALAAGHTSFMLVARLGSDTMTGENPVAIEVELPRELLAEMDEFATRRGYVTQGRVVRRALERREE